MWHGYFMMQPPDSAEYERLVESLVGQLGLRAEVRSERIKRDVRVPGRSTTNQIDVLWDFVDAQGRPQRVAFEARSYRNRVDQGKLHAFRSVVDDIQDEARPVTGVMVTTVGYQRGAKSVASTYGVVVLELRAPTDADLKNRLGKIIVTVGTQVPIIDNVEFEAIEVYEEHFPSGPDDPRVFTVRTTEADANAELLKDVLCRGEVGNLGDPRSIHHVRREFNPPATLLVRGRKAALIHAVTAQVGDVEAPPVTVTIGGLETIAWLLRDSLSGARAWIAADGQVWTTDS